MSKKRTLSYLACSLLLGASLAACGHKTDDTTGQNSDSLVNSIEQKTANAADTVGDKAADLKDQTVALADDASITTSVRSKIVKDPDLSNLDISVDTKGGVVTLEGKTKSDAARDKAVQIARAVPGVTEVNNNLLIDTDKNS